VLDHIPELPLTQAELKRIVEGVPAKLDPLDLGQAAIDLDAQIAADLYQISADSGLTDAEALAVQIVWVRMYLAKLGQLQTLFEATRH